MLIKTSVAPQLPNSRLKELGLPYAQCVSLQHHAKSVVIKVCEALSCQGVSCILVNSLQTECSQLGLIKESGLLGRRVCDGREMVTEKEMEKKVGQKKNTEKSP